MAEIKTLYNADCPVCNFEISHYVRYAKAQGLALDFEDLNDADLASWGLTKDEAMRRMYVAHDGELVSGIPAFLILWREMPRYRWVARLVGLPVIKQIAAAAYDWVAAPLIYRWALRRNAAASR